MVLWHLAAVNVFVVLLCELMDIEGVVAFVVILCLLMLRRVSKTSIMYLVVVDVSLHLDMEIN